MDEISVEGKTYVKAKVLARELGYTSDYVGQLCRAGKVRSQLVGRTWYVDPDSIKGHKGARYRSTRVTTQREIRSELQKTLREQAVEREHFYRAHRPTAHPDISYETDESELLPQTQKSKETKSAHQLRVELADATEVPVDSDTNTQYHFEAPEKEQTKFFGTLRVTDYVSEVKVGGDTDDPHPVKVVGKSKHSHHAIVEKKSSDFYAHPVSIHKDEAYLKSAEEKAEVPVDKKTPAVMHIAVPVAVESEVVPIPLSYHLFTAGSFVAALIISAMCVGLEATITVDANSMTTEYAFTVEHMSAALFTAE